MSSGEIQEQNEQGHSAAEQLAEANERIAQMLQELSDLHIERKLAQRLAAAGAIDLETIVLVAKARMDGKTEADIDRCIDQLRREKAHLFGAPVESQSLRKTAGARDRAGQNQTALEQAAKRAAQTGRRADLLHYMRLRRNMI